MLQPRNANLLGMLLFYLTVALAPAEVETGEVWTRVDGREIEAIKDFTVAGNLLIAVGSGGMISTSENGGIWRQAEAHPADFNSIASGGGLLVAAGSGDSCYTSIDGFHWTRRVTGVSATWNDVSWTGSRFVMVGSGGAIVSSANGVDWFREISGTTQSLLDIVEDAGVVHVLASNSAILRSTLPGSWEIIPNAAYSFYHLAEKGGRLVAGGLIGTAGLRYSDNGSTWTKATVLKAGDSNTTIRSIVSGPPGFVALNEGGELVHSEDGISWHQRILPILESPVALRWTGAEFVAITRSRRILRSADGRSWSADGVERARESAWTGSLHVVVGLSGFIARSTDGIHWTSSVSGTVNDLRGIAWNGERFIATGALGTILASEDGITWSPVPTGKWDLNGITWTGERFIALAGEGMILSSADGLSWEISDPGRMDAVLWDGSRFLAVHHRSVLVSADGDFWQYLGVIEMPAGSISTSSRIRDIVWTGSLYVAVGDSGYFLSSPDGISWSKRTPATAAVDSWLSVAFSGEKLIAIGRKYVARSTDGLTWTAAETGPYFESIEWTGSRWIGCGTGRTGYSLNGETWVLQGIGAGGPFLRAIASGGARYVAVGSNGWSPLIMSSADGVAWTTYTFAGNRWITDVAWTGGRYVAALSDGRYLVSPDGASWEEVGGATSARKEFLVSKDGVIIGFAASTQAEFTGDGLSWSAGTSRGGATHLSKVRHFAGRTIAVANDDVVVNEAGDAWVRSPDVGAKEVFHHAGKYLLMRSNEILESETGLTWTAWAGGRPPAPDDFQAIGGTAGGKLLLVQKREIWRYDEASGWSLSTVIPDFYPAAITNVGSRILMFSGLCHWSDDEGETWTPPGPSPRVDSSLWDVTGFANGFVATGDYGRLLVSEDDGLNWEGVPTFNWNTNYSVATDGSRLVALTGGLQTSTDGRTWEPVSGESIYGTDVEWTGNKFVLLNPSGVSQVSSDGLSWTLNPLTDGVGSISGVNGPVIGLTGRSVTSGPDVTAVQTRPSFNFGPMASSGSVHVTLSWGPWRSEDLISWDYRGSTWTTPSGITWTGSRFVTVGGSSSNSGYSTDGVDWTVVPAARGSAVIWTGDRLYSFDGSGVVRTSPDGVAWSSVPDDTSQSLSAAAWAGSFGVAVGNAGTVLRSVDGSSWSTVAAGLTARLNSVVWTGTQVVAVGNSGVAASSTDGLTWQSVNVGTASILRSVAHNDGLLVTVSEAGEIFSSVNGTAWTKRFGNSGCSFSCVTWTGNRFAAVGRFGAVVLSVDGITWQVAVRGPGNLAMDRVPSGTSETFVSAGSSGSRWLALGSMGSILHSDDGMVWTEAGRPTTTALRDAVRVDGRFVVVGDAGVILTSPDGAEWTKRESNTTLDLVAVTRRGSTVVAAGDNGLILRSKAGEAPLWTFDFWADSLDDDLPEADPDGDGFTNLVAYAMGWPTGRVPAHLVDSLPGINPTFQRRFEFRLGADERYDVRYDIERSTNLGLWTTVASRVRGAWSGTSALMVSESADGNGNRLVSLDLADAPMAFYRLRFTKVSP